jgi:hypothetical protein
MLSAQQPALGGVSHSKRPAVAGAGLLGRPSGRRAAVAVRAIAEPVPKAAAAPLVNHNATLNISPVPAAPAPAAPAAAAPEIVAPAALYARVADAGAAKAGMPWQKVAVMGVLAGVYIGFGGLLSLVVGGNSPGAGALARLFVTRLGTAAANSLSSLAVL